MATKTKSTSEPIEETMNGINGFPNLNGIPAPSLEAFKTSIERAVEMNKENVEALVECMTAATKGIEILSGESLSFVKQVISDSVKASKEMFSVKSPQEFMTKQSDFSRSVFDQFVNQATKVNDLGMTAMKNAYAPINERVTSLAKSAQQSRVL